MIDFHSHVLPGIDDGSDCVAESIAMLQMEAEQGITRVVATPHFYPSYDAPETFLLRRAHAAKVLRREMEKHPGLPGITLGAEVYFFPGMSDSEVIPQLTIGGKGGILIEMPQSPWTMSMYRELEQIWLKWHITPIIAHVDRYIAPFRTHRIPECLADLPVLVQANASFFLQRSTAGMAMRMLRDGQIHLLGSDCHNTDSRKPNLGPALEKIRNKLGDGVIDEIHDCGRNVLHL